MTLVVLTTQPGLLIDQRGFSLVLVGGQLALVTSVLVLLAIWWIEWRNGRVWSMFILNNEALFV